MNRIPHTVSICLLALLSLHLTSCIKEDVPECTYDICFDYTWNLLYADAFPSQVDDITLYIFRPDGTFIGSQHDEGSHLDANYRMPLKLAPGRYHLIAWGGNDPRFYETTELTAGVSTADDLTVTLRRNSSNGIRHEASLKGLFHGECDIDIPEYYSGSATVHLMNDTKNINVLIQHTRDPQLNPTDYSCTIRDDNGRMDSHNNLLPDATLTYHPYFTAGSQIEDLITPDKKWGVVKFELNTLRLMRPQTRIEEPPTVLRIENHPRETVQEFNLQEYILMLKNSYFSTMPEQEYLDRLQECNIVFFINNDVVVSVQIEVGPWKVVKNLNTEL
ncbi:MAG: FimB/Mfa2 family fimbrial subunit [Clostridium sp.]|nr:FimB/Mfa2 family fimbrial subunit [Clostridium sp.]